MGRQPSSVYPPAIVGESLERSRAAGLDFWHAWQIAWDAVPWASYESAVRRTWKEALADTRGEWWDAYERRESSVGAATEALREQLED